MTSCKVMIAKAAYTDLEQLIRYISDELAEPQPALKLTNKFESAILSLSEMPALENSALHSLVFFFLAP